MAHLHPFPLPFSSSFINHERRKALEDHEPTRHRIIPMPPLCCQHLEYCRRKQLLSMLLSKFLQSLGLGGIPQSGVNLYTQLGSTYEDGFYKMFLLLQCWSKFWSYSIGKNDNSARFVTSSSVK